MKAKVLGMVAALAVLGTSSVFAFGIGLQVNGNAGEVFVPGAAVTFKVDSIPLVFAVNWFGGDNATVIGLTGDYWGVNRKLVSIGSAPLNWFFGVGFFVNTVFADEFILNGGIRFPLGLNMFILDGFLEPFVQVAPSIGLQVVPSLDVERFFFPIAAGFRLWFK